jgi:hypothetical protein
MGTLAAILGILAALTPVFVTAWKKHQAKKEDPINQLAEQKEQNAKDLITRSPERINTRLDDDLNELQSLQGDQQRPGSDPADHRTAVHSKL